MYFIYRHNKKVSSLGSFRNYEHARQAARKYIRKLKSYSPVGWFSTGSNPHFVDFNVKIKLV